MQLTTTQIQQVSNWIANQKITDFDSFGRKDKKHLYYDIQCEMTDHIASNIEDVMQTDNNSFNEAFEIAKHKWNATELLKLEQAKEKVLRSKFIKLYFSTFKKLFLSPKILFVLLVGIVLFKLLMIDEFWFSQIKFVVSISCLLLGLGLILVNMFQTEKINGKQNRFLLNSISFRIIAVLTGLNAVITNFAFNFFVEPMDFFNAETYDFFTNSIKLSILLTLMICNVAVVYFVIHRQLKSDLKKYVMSYSN
nr:hypothetical protein [uncultured Flavobacterium sp.]